MVGQPADQRASLAHVAPVQPMFGRVLIDRQNRIGDVDRFLKAMLKVLSV